MEGTDEILNVCFGEGLFKTPLRWSKCTAEKEIPTRKYTNTLQLIYESQKLNKDGLASPGMSILPTIKTRNTGVKEEDTLYYIFAVE